MHIRVASIVVLALWSLSSAMAQTKNTASTNKVKSFDHLVINVSDMERALAFYKRLGFTLINEDGWRRGQGQVSIKIGDNQKINIHKTRRPESAKQGAGYRSQRQIQPGLYPAGRRRGFLPGLGRYDSRG